MEKKDSVTAESRKLDIRAVPDPEVTEKAVRRKFTAAYKLRILKEAEGCTEAGAHISSDTQRPIHALRPLRILIPRSSAAG
ncbi:MAG: hypothetical protein NTX36_15765 [Proteobacteria bacterium]|nr:hypothetical protein [Pseudomonadota bacterium]